MSKHFCCCYTDFLIQGLDNFRILEGVYQDLKECQSTVVAPSQRNKKYRQNRVMSELNQEQSSFLEQIFEVYSLPLKTNALGQLSFCSVYYFKGMTSNHFFSTIVCSVEILTILNQTFLCQFLTMNHLHLKIPVFASFNSQGHSPSALYRNTTRMMFTELATFLAQQLSYIINTLLKLDLLSC